MRRFGAAGEVRALVAVLALLLAAPVGAHRGHASLSVVALDGKGGVVVTHRFAAHDVEPALVKIAPDAQPSLDDPAAVEALVAYVARRFAVQGAALTLRSKALTGDDVTLVFGGRLARARQVTVRADLFGETHPGHSAQVNVRHGGVTRTVWFKPGDAAQTVSFSR